MSAEEGGKAVAGTSKFDCFHAELVSDGLRPSAAQTNLPVNATVVFSRCRSTPGPDPRLTVDPAGEPLGASSTQPLPSSR